VVVVIKCRESKVMVAPKPASPVVKGKPLANVKVRINPGDFNVKLTDVLTTSDTVLTLKKLIFEMTSPKVEDATVGEEDADSSANIQTVNKKGTSNTSNNGRELPVCPVERQRVMFVGKELKNTDILGNVGVDTVRIVQIFMRAEQKK
jgi:hypothetical protein